MYSQWPSSDSELSSHYSTNEHSRAHWDPRTVKPTAGLPEIESKYVIKHLGTILSKCLAEVLERRPLDPIEYMATWMYSYMENKERLSKEQAENEELNKQREEKEREDELLGIGRPDAPLPNSLHRLSNSSGDDEFDSDFSSFDRKLRAGINRRKSDLNPSQIKSGTDDLRLPGNSDETSSVSVPSTSGTSISKQEP